MSYFTVWQMGTKVSKKNANSIFRVEEDEYGGSIFVHNICAHLSDYMASHHRRL
jgi:hypothetical protein